MHEIMLSNTFKILLEHLSNFFCILQYNLYVVPLNQKDKTKKLTKDNLKVMYTIEGEDNPKELLLEVSGGEIVSTEKFPFGTIFKKIETSKTGYTDAELKVNFKFDNADKNVFEPELKPKPVILKSK